MTRASIYTLLSLDRYFSIMRVNPAHASGAAGVTGGAAPFVLKSSCSEYWFQYDWQGNNKVSREALAEEIAKAEEDIARALGYWPAPIWLAEEVQMYPQYHRQDMMANSVNVRGDALSVKTKWGKVVAPGRRALELLCHPYLDGTIIYSDEDGDGYEETATIECRTDSTADPCEIKAYFTGHNGDPEWEIRPPRSVTNVAGLITMVFWSWQLIEPDLWENLPNEGENIGLDLNDDIYIDEVDLYREYNDTTAVSSVFYWEPTCGSTLECACGGVGCSACGLTTQDGCLHIRDSESGIVVPAPAVYGEEGWCGAGWTRCERPTFVKLWYLAGELSNQMLRGFGCDPLSNFWAQTIAWLATARLGQPLCGCSTAGALVTQLQTDTAFMGKDGGWSLSESDRDNPFGTLYGEVRAWRRVNRLTDHRMESAVI